MTSFQTKLREILNQHGKYFKGSQSDGTHWLLELETISAILDLIDKEGLTRDRIGHIHSKTGEELDDSVYSHNEALSASRKRMGITKGTS